MAALTNYGEALVIDWLLRKDAVANPIRPSGLYLSLHTADPTEAGLMTAEIVGGAYARQVVTFISSSGTGDTQNSGTITYPIATSTWGTITHWGLNDALVNGNMIMFGIANQSQTITAGLTYSVGSSVLTINFD